jgi:serine/threonine-protein kinase HipA
MVGRSKKAFVYLRESRAGLLEKIEGGYRFSYLKEYLSSRNAQPVSLTLPLTDKPYVSDQLFSFFLGLIPEGWLLDLTSRTLKIDQENPFDILLATGGDCIGAVIITPIDEEIGNVS